MSKRDISWRFVNLRDGTHFTDSLNPEFKTTDEVIKFHFISLCDKVSEINQSLDTNNKHLGDSVVLNMSHILIMSFSFCVFHIPNLELPG